MSLPFFQRKRKWGPEAPYPLSLTKREVTLLVDFYHSEGYEVYQQLIETLAQQRSEQLLRPATADEHNFYRGVLYGYRELYDIIERLMDTSRRYDERRAEATDDGGTDHSRFWGHPGYHDFWRKD